MVRPQLPCFHDGVISLSYSQPYFSIERSDTCSKSLLGWEKFEMLMRACAICTTQRSGVGRFRITVPPLKVLTNADHSKNTCFTRLVDRLSIASKNVCRSLFETSIVLSITFGNVDRFVDRFRKRRSFWRSTFVNVDRLVDQLFETQIVFFYK